MKRYIMIDTITGLQVDSFDTMEIAISKMKEWEQNDKEAGLYEPNSYEIEEVEY